MKDIRAAIRSLILTDPATFAYVTTNCVSRVFPAVLPQGINKPSVVQNLITESTDYVTPQGPSGLGHARVQLDCWASTLDSSVTLGDLVNKHLSGFSGTIMWGSDSPKSSLQIRGIFAETARDNFDPRALLYTRRRDFIIWFVES